MNKINIVCSTDNNFVKYCLPMMCSVLENAKNPKKIKFFVLLTDNLAKENSLLIQNFVEKYGASLEFVKIKKSFYKGFPNIPHLTFNTYSRLFFSDLKPEIDRFIYLDCDLIVEADIEELWNKKTKKIISAVYDIGLNYQYNYFNVKKKYFFNAGVLIVNSKLFREKKYLNLIINFLIKNKNNLWLGDQDALNFVFYSNWFELPLCWNVTNRFSQSLIINEINLKLKIKKAFEKPKIIHFTPGYKPLSYFCESPFKSRFFYYLQKTNLKNIKIDDKKISKILYIKIYKRYISQLIPYFIKSSIYYFIFKKNN